jgi:hypothetical protein
MTSIIKNITLAVIVMCLISSTVRAESPFSSLGHGLLIESANARSSGMGYTSLAILDTLSLDRRNIAAWSGPATARLGLGGNITRTSVEDVYGSDLRDQGGLSGIAIAVPVGESTFLGLAISHITRVSYDWAVTGSADQDWSSTIEKHNGTGGMSQGILGMSFPYGEKFRFGIGARGIFGKSERYWQVEFPDATSWATTYLKSDRYKGFGLSASAHYKVSPQWMFGLAINSPVSVRIQRQNLIERQELSRNVKIIQLDSTTILDDELDVPLEVAVGVGHIMGKHAFAGELAWKGWGSVNEATDPNNTLEDALRLSFGWEWMPGYRAFDPIWRLITYRAGIYNQEHYAQSLSGNQSNRTALTGGLGIPFNRGLSRIDIALELGMMGSQSDDGVAEKFAVITVGFNNSEHWFKGFREGR